VACKSGLQKRSGTNDWSLHDLRRTARGAEGVVVPFLRTPATAARFLEMGELKRVGSKLTWIEPYIASEKDKLAEIVRRAGIQPE
jgi:hypothetical protein